MKPLKDLERDAIISALREACGVQKDAAKALGITERVMSYKMRKYQIDRKAIRFGRLDDLSEAIVDEAWRRIQALERWRKS